MPLGFDTAVDCSRYASRLAGLGYQFACRYLTRPGDWRYFSKFEAMALSRAGIRIVSLFEVNSDPRHYNANNGRDDAREAIRRAQAIDQGAESSICYCVDTDAASPDAVTTYFAGVNGIHYYPGSDWRLSVSVYGSGAICSRIRDTENLATYAMLAQSPGWQGTPQFKTAEIVQRFGTPQQRFPFAPDKFEIDPCECDDIDSIGAWTADVSEAA